MPKIAVCTAFHELARPFLQDYIAGLLAEAKGRDLVLVAAIDNLGEPERALADMTKALPVSFHAAKPRASIAEVRAVMLDAARECGADILVFLDADDVIEAGAVDRHLAALASADISYGDAQPIDEGGRELGPRLFDGLAVPETVVSSAEIVRRNFFGLSNTAMRRAALAGAACKPPRDNDATDWWVFTTLLDNGATARRAKGVVVRYRMHGANLLGIAAAADATTLAKRCRMAARHFAALPPTPERRKASDAVSRLERALAIDPDRWVGKARDIARDRSAWFEDVFRLADEVERVEGRKN